LLPVPDDNLGIKRLPYFLLLREVEALSLAKLAAAVDARKLRQYSRGELAAWLPEVEALGLNDCALVGLKVAPVEETVDVPEKRLRVVDFLIH
jgi:hypothetical protein